MLHIAFLLYAMIRMAGGADAFLQPVSLLFALWAVAPTAFLIRRSKHAQFWLIALVPVIAYGTYAAYDMAFMSDSSTAALGWIYVPLYEWIFIALFRLGKMLAVRD